MRRLLFGLGLMAALLLAARAFWPATNTPDQPKLATPDNSDYYMEQAVIWQMGDGGQLVYRMTLGEVLHFPDDSARLRDIDVHYLDGTKTRWDVTAARGRVPAGRRDIHLTGGVKGRHPRPGDGVLTVTTDNAWVRPERDRIDTEAHVTAVSPGQRVEAQGMQANLKTDELKLLNNVQVTYTP